MNRWTPRIFSILTLALVFAVGACGDDDSSTEPETTLSGSYTLASANNAPLPYQVFEAGDTRLEVTAGTATFTASGTFTSSLTFRETVAGEVETSIDTASGTYTRSGNSVTLNIPDDEDSPYQATASGNSLTLTVDGISFRFTK